MCSDSIHMKVFSFAGRSSALLVCAAMMVEPANPRPHPLHSGLYPTGHPAVLMII